ncbi:PA14 domain-containing protein [Streptomyces sp. NPDC001982]|uniref:PA14 domain-containing protein n=1 Tax=Streptomyces sp. NPDC001982 TaxID=3154405 RepID=UPI00331682AC
MAAAGVVVGVGGLLTAVPASAAVTCASPTWRAQFYANTSFSGTPKLTACDTAISENYGTGDPAGVSLPRDNFSIRWTVTRDFGSGGPFTLAAEVQDGIRVYLDGARKLDVWKNVSTTQKKSVNVTIPSGKHTLRVDFVAWTGSANVKFVYTPRTSATVDKVRPLAPTGTSAAYNTVSRAATVRWSKNKEMDLAGYRVYRRPTGTSTWTRVSGSTPLTGTSYSNTPPATGQTFYYEVRAVDKAGNESSGSTDQPVTTVDKTGPAAPQNVTVTGDHYGNLLAWGAVTDAASYEVYAAAQSDGTYSLLKKTTGRAYTDAAAPYGVLRYYRIRALDALGNPSAFSVTVSGDHIDRTPPEPPTRVSAVANSDDVRLYWTMPSPFEDELANGATFRVYRSEGTTLDAAATTITCGNQDETGSDPIAVACSDTAWSDATVYTYAITAVDGAGNESARSETVTVRTAEKVAPLPLTGLTATPRADGTLLSWNAPVDDDVAFYRAFRGVRQDDGTVHWIGELTHCVDRDDDPLALLCIDLPDGEDYVYTVVAVDRWNNGLSVTDSSIPTVTATELDVLPSTPLVNGDPVFGSWGWSVSEDAPTLSWSCQNAAICAGVTGYRLSRWNPTTGAYEPLLNESLPATTTRYTDTTAPLGQTSFYRVSGILADGTETTPADFWRIRPDLA